MSKTLAAIGDGYNQAAGTHVIDGVSVSGVPTIVGDRFRMTISATLIDPEIARDHFLNVVRRAIDDQSEVTRKAQAELKRLTAIVKKDGRAATDRGDADSLRGLGADVDDAIRLSQKRTFSQVLRLVKALDDPRTDFLFDRAPIDAAVIDLNKLEEVFEQHRDGLRALRIEIDRLAAEATSPQTLRRLAEEGQEIRARAIVTRLADDLAQAQKDLQAVQVRLTQIVEIVGAAR
ncbi:MULTISPECIES: hypothetical protein [unclassified Inquilinus]|uniref:hypothetical protein n=1 Tax=unclassified Inquilinus TaxID=2645927 RepID=UPI003F8EBCBD